jgi:hypothetical protein
MVYLVVFLTVVSVTLYIVAGIARNHMTPTGETYGERKSYHDRGELSPGEHAAAIRERPQQ